jgi:hypothetical protein
MSSDSDVTPSELRQDRARIAFICFLTVVPWTLAEFFHGLLLMIVYPFFGCPISLLSCPALATFGSRTFYLSTFLSLPAQLSQVIGILLLNRQFRQLLRAHILGGFQPF